MITCPFCRIAAEDVVWESDGVLAFRDRFPVSPGHTLVITRAHRETYFDASNGERAEIWRAVELVKQQLDQEFDPAGYNVGFNAQAAAGQTVMHLHVHVIPRYEDDVADPRGGIRGVIPGKQRYEGMPPASGSTEVRDAGPAYASNPFVHLPTFVPGEEVAFSSILRQAFHVAQAVDVVVAFVQPAGVKLIREDLRQALGRGVHVRLLTGDYMNTTSPDALRMLLTLASEFPERFFPSFYLGGGRKSFHAKAYIFAQGDQGIAFVGSSNLSQGALTDGIEWNLRTVSSSQSEEFQAIRRRFEQLLRSPNVLPLTRELVEQYAERVPIPPAPDPRLQPLVPHAIQKEALASLQKLRKQGARAGLVVMATGLGKTYLSALDYVQLGGKRGLFIAHREEILTQAKDAWERVLPDRTLGMLVGDSYDHEADVVFASIQTLSRTEHLQRFAPDHFDYLVIDEIHHAAARTYRKVAGHFRPTFLLGLTATPDRMDGKSILDLCHDNLAYRAGLIRGIEAGLLVPFRYFGVRDSIDFEHIPWRGRWPIEELTAQANTQERADQSLREYRRHAPPTQRRALAFCCSTGHADYMAEYFRSKGVPAAAVHSGQSSAPRSESLELLRAGDLEILCAVDIFNEGLDVPDINVVLMLRPTESPVIFLQQLGRGLRRSLDASKPHLTVIDFIGNHRSFMMKPQALLSLVGQDSPPGAALQSLRGGNLELPEGCSVDIETEAIEMLERVARLNRDDVLIYQYRSLQDGHGRRPTPAEVYATGVSVRRPVKDHYGTWFNFVDQMGGLNESEQLVLSRYADWFSDLFTTSMSRCYKMVTLRAMLEGKGLTEPATVSDLVRRAKRIMEDDPLLQQELEEAMTADDPEHRLAQIWRNQPLRVWSEGKGTTQTWFSFEYDEFQLVLDVPTGDVATFEEMSSELVDFRLAEYRDRLRGKAADLLAPMRLRVSHANGNPILRFDRKRLPAMPEPGSEIWVRVAGEEYLFRVQKIAVNVAQSEPGGGNVLPTLMRGLFGPNAGLPGTNQFVLLAQNEGRWFLEREGEVTTPTASIVPFPKLPFFEDYRVACGTLEFGPPGEQIAEQLPVAVPEALDSTRHFVVAASGDSMEGEDSEFPAAFPIRDGDLVLCEWIDVTSVDAVAGRICLLSGFNNRDLQVAALKIPVLGESGWMLHSTNPDQADEPVPAGVRLRPIAQALRVVEEATEPTLWGRYDRAAVTRLFGAKNDRSWQVGHRDVEVGGDGHTVLFVTLRKGDDTPVEQRYADRFLSPQEFQWESQVGTKPEDKKARSILDQETNGQAIHLFCRYKKKEDFVYCGRLRYKRHQGAKPIRVWFQLEQPLPESLWRVWAA